MINPQRWAQVDDILAKIIELPGDDYQKYVNTHFKNDTELYTELTSFAKIRDNKNNILPENITLNAELLTVIEDNFDELSLSFLGKKIGHYTIDYLLGKGGNGLVFSAIRSDGKIAHKVAIKLLTSQANSHQLKQRFIQEQKILAQLKHPNIVKLFDVGIHRQADLFIIMEQIEGIAINKYCLQKQLTIRQILGLFLHVTKAIKYAHKHLIVHRDIKPANILINEHGEVKLLDFGIAKILQQNKDKTITKTGISPMTLRYASPEQIKQTAITTATDIYQLGLLLCELLTGKLPYKVENNSRYALEKSILSQDFEKPSTLLRKQLNSNPVDKKTIKSKIKSIRGELDAIVLKALSQSDKFSYESVEMLQKDIISWLTGLPVSAQKQSSYYRLNKFMYRHKVSVISLLSLLTITTTLILFYTHKLQKQRNIAVLEAGKSKQVTTFLAQMFANANPEISGKYNLQVIELLNKESQKLSQNSTMNTEVKSAIEFVIAQSYDSLGDYTKAQKLYEKVLKHNIKQAGANSHEVAKVYNQLSALFLKKGELKQALANAKIAEKIAYANNNLEFLAETLNNLANAQAEYGLLSEAKSNLQHAIAIKLKIKPLNSLSLAGSLKNLAAIYQKEKNFNQAIKIHQKALLFTKDGSYLKATLLNDLSSNLRNIGKIDEALAKISQVLTIKKQIYGIQHASYAQSLLIKGNILKDKGQAKQALQIYLQALEIYQNVYGKGAPRNAIVLNNIANIYFEENDYIEAQNNFQNALNIVENKLPQNHSIVVGLKIGLAQSLLRRKEYTEVENILLPIQKLLENNSNRFYLTYSQFVLGQSYCASSKRKQGKKLLQKSLKAAKRMNVQDLPIAEIQLAYEQCNL